jgi:DNA-binding transcriptional LysR family regulator
MSLTSGHLALLVEIQRTGSLARAALTLAVSPPAVSQQLARLERDVGAPLVERGARGARLTRLGERLAVHGTRVADELRRAEETAADFIGVHRNRLRVGAPASVTYRLLPDVLAAIRFRFPAAELSVDDILSDAGPGLVADGALDLAVSASYGSLPNVDAVTSHHVLADPMLVVLPENHPLGAEPGPVDLAGLADEPWASGPPGRPSRTQLDVAAADRGFVPHVPFQTESYDVAQALTQAGVAVSLIPRLALTHRPGTRARPTAAGLVRDIVAIVPASHDHVPLADVLLGHLAEVALGQDRQR